MKTTAIIVAAGTGSRFKSETPKQFAELGGKPIVVHSIERLAAAPSVDALIVVVASEHVTRLGGMNISKPVRVVTGGATRAESVSNGLRAVEDDAELVAVHDGARPFVSVDEIERTIAKAKEMGARAQQVYRSQSGALDRTLSALEVLMWMPESIRENYQQKVGR